MTYNRVKVAANKPSEIVFTESIILLYYFVCFLINHNFTESMLLFNYFVCFLINLTDTVNGKTVPIGS